MGVEKGKMVPSGVKLDGYFHCRCNRCGFVDYILDPEIEVEHDCLEKEFLF